MARYLITIEQFAAFVADCYRDRKWQLPPGCSEYLPDDFPPKHQTRGGNYPADSVSWYDARAFCSWLGARLNTEIRLPTEAEWQIAATGGDPARLFPWGPDWSPAEEQWLANTRESGLGRSTPVGFYPLGASPAGVLDMAGNLQEWCLNPVDPKERSRVLRGGSWDVDQEFARSTVRVRRNPDFRYFSIGFRVACSSPSMNTGH
jgi:formylglycine-generating enzyme required for sulfatase activity